MAAETGDYPIDPNKIAYVYMQVADHIAARIASGELQPGARLAGERDLGTEYGVAYLTARRAVRELRDRGLVITLPAKGTFVAYPETTDDGQEP
ncbi:GntR family transcriptional regulator [Streptomyces dioscori]|uniref:GntR family transcriptional regulator n=1 Tax=Streptomyces dioscori TaxID=2109333 RepID=A0A2P8PXQ8_9ACTN|nr:winged helix-turn-helix domain-containing protein [Streptomyces dioscori]PSM38774.1 GntR family transcriptional regulator [Streptomyces dioscori]